MAIPLNKFAEQCEQVAMTKGDITPDSSPSVSFYGISREWRELRKATDFRDLDLQGWSEREKCTADVIIAALVYLRRIGCNGIEKLLREALEIRARQNT
mgnify:FL=1